MGIDQVRSIVLVGAGKGGVGKSTITSLLAHAFNKLGLQVGILDADLYGPSIPKMFGFDSLKDKVSLNEQGQILPLILQNISILSIALFQNEKPAIVRAPVANSFINELLFKTNWGPLDILLIDLPPGTSDIHLTILQQIKAACAVVVTTPQSISYQDAKKAAQMFSSMGVSISAVIENFSGILNVDGQTSHLFDGNAGETLQKEFEIELFKKIPLDARVSNQLDQGINPFSFDTPVTKNLEQFSKELRDLMWIGKQPCFKEETLCSWN